MWVHLSLQRTGGGVRLAFAVSVGWAFAAAIFTGCSGNAGPQRVVVSGTVTYRGQPVERGWIRFFPQQGQLPASGAVIVDGKYQVADKGGVPTGTHRIEVVAYRAMPQRPADSPSTGLSDPRMSAPQSQYIPAKYNAKTTLEIAVPPGSSRIAKNFDLTD